MSVFLILFFILLGILTCLAFLISCFRDISWNMSNLILIAFGLTKLIRRL